jgi:hypothetical protein
MKSPSHSCFALLGILFFCFFAKSARANVYATDIRLNGSLHAGVVLPGGSVAISYILNDTASGGVWVRIYSGANLIQTLSSADDEAGTNAGLNSAVWNDPADTSQGIYTVSITAASAGYGSWTNITDDGPNFYVEAPGGITVDENTNSPFYGRVYVANALFSWDIGAPGILKCNADGTPADEGGFSTGGWNWSGAGYSPWKMTVGADDRLYVDDFASDGVVISFDPILRNNDHRVVLGTSNYPTQDPTPQLSGLAFATAGTNTQIWMTDENPSGSAGIIGWQLTNGGVVAANDTGSVIVPLDSDFLTQAPYDLDLDSNGFLYTIQFLTGDSPAYALMEFPPYAGSPEMSPNWAVSDYPALLYASGVAVNPSGSSVAVAVSSQDIEADPAGGGLYLYQASNGDFLANVDETGGDAYYDAAWDRVGNLYALDATAQVWRAYSPPGTNQATTVAVPLIQVYDTLAQPTLANPVARPGSVQFTLEGQSNVTYVIDQSFDLMNWTPVATNYSTNLDRNICIPTAGGPDFFRARTGP